MVSDDASIFTSSEFIEFYESNGIRRRLIAPDHPQTNGQVERYVQSLKRKLDAMESISGTLLSKIRKILFRYRATPLRCEKTPAELYLGRQIRTKLDLLKPYKATTKRAAPVSKSCLRSVRVGDRAIVKMYTCGKEIWKPGIIIEKYGRLHYRVQLDDRYALKRHIDQLCRTKVSRHVSFEDSSSNNRQRSDQHAGNTSPSRTQQQLSPPGRFIPAMPEDQAVAQPGGLAQPGPAQLEPAQPGPPKPGPARSRPHRLRRPPVYLKYYIQ
nr:uncharacterized protein LOC106690425 [Halyomorpha halys]